MSSYAANAQPAHIHKGTCASLDPTPAYPLHDIVAGRSLTVVRSRWTLSSKGKYAINLHRSAEKLKVYVACGDITRSRRPPRPSRRARTSAHPRPGELMLERERVPPGEHFRTRRRAPPAPRGRALQASSSSRTARAAPPVDGHRLLEALVAQRLEHRTDKPRPSQRGLRCALDRSYGSRAGPAPHREAAARSPTSASRSAQGRRRSQNARDLHHRALRRRTSGTPRRRTPRRRSRPGAGSLPPPPKHLAVGDQRSHRVVRLDGDDAGEPFREPSRQAAGSRRKVEHAGVQREPQLGLCPVERLARVRGPDSVVQLRDAPEAQAQRRFSRHPRAGTRDSP